MSVTICSIKKHSMSSNSPSDDARRTSSRKPAGQMPPHYLARETNERKGGVGAKKLGVGLKKRTAAMKQSESPPLYDDDSDSVTSVQPRKKSRARLCIPTEFRRIPAEFRHKAPAVPVPDRNRRRNVL
jgi:hypothetical protein